MAQLQNFTGPLSIDELRWDDLVLGTGAAVLPGATVTIHYTGALASDGTIFDSSLRGENPQPATFPLDMLIAGWQKGIPGMKAGGTRRLFIPAELGYGASGAGSIPPNADLVFDIELFASEGGSPS
jgi:FKBP-type peptidyl-prolyl cis-trans isomerase